MSQISTSNTLGVSSSERINNIHQFLQGANPLGLADDSVKAILALEAACGELASNEQLKRQRSESLPQLIKPKMQAMKLPSTSAYAVNEKSTEADSSFNANSVLISAFASLRQLLHEGNIGELSSRLQLLNLESASLLEKGNALLNAAADSTEKAKVIADKATAQGERINTVKASLSNLESLQHTYQQQLAQIQQKITPLQSQLHENKTLLTQVDGMAKPNTEEAFHAESMLQANIASLTAELQPLLDEQQNLVSQIQKQTQEIGDLNRNIKSLSDDVYQLGVEGTALSEVASTALKEFGNFMEEAPRGIQVDGEKWENTLALLTMLTAQLKKAMNEDSLRNMKEQEETLAKINEASRKDSEKKAKEAAEAERKAADANKAASCASKIFSYVMLAVSVIATVATFGAAAPLTLAVAAIGIALSVADIVLEETGQGSLMQMLAAEISSAVTDMLITFGVPEEEAKKIGSIVGMVLAAVAFLALSLLSMSSFVKNIANTVTNVTKMLAKNVGTLLKSTVKAIPKSFTNALGSMATKGTKMGQSVADNADEMVKLTKFTKLTDKFDDVQNIAKAADKSSDYVSLGGQMVNVGDSAKFANKLDDVKEIAKTAEKVVSKGKGQSVNMARLEVGMKGTGAGLSVANAATSGGLRLEAAAQMRDMKEMLSGMMLNNETIQALTELLNALIKSMSKTYDQFDEMFSGMMTSLNQSNNNKVDMLKTARFA